MGGWAAGLEAEGGGAEESDVASEVVVGVEPDRCEVAVLVEVERQLHVVVRTRLLQFDNRRYSMQYALRKRQLYGLNGSVDILCAFDCCVHLRPDFIWSREQ